MIFNPCSRTILLPSWMSMESMSRNFCMLNSVLPTSPASHQSVWKQWPLSGYAILEVRILTVGHMIILYYNTVQVGFHTEFFSWGGGGGGRLFSDSKQTCEQTVYKTRPSRGVWGYAPHHQNSYSCPEIESGGLWQLADYPKLVFKNHF